MKPRVLVVDDDRALRYTLRGLLEHAGMEIEEAGDGVEALEKLNTAELDLVITDLRMPRLDGLGLLREIQARATTMARPPRTILVTAQGSEREAVEAIKGGAYDYFKKPFEVEELMAVVGRALESVRLTAEVERLSSELHLSRSLIFVSQPMSRLALLVQRVAPRDVTVLLTGESGTGKERVAEALVGASARAGKPFVRFNCAALTSELAEAELFGHTKGAFTAVKERPGLFREANGGTILLDEIGELALVTQAKLLRVLQEAEIRPVGEDRSVKVDVRIVAATHRDLLQLVSEGKFREDLYYRLKVVHLQIPPLRERPQDIPVLARHFLRQYSRRFGVGPFNLTAAFMDRLTSYAWPGNVRELENAIESLVALSHEELDLDLLPGAGRARPVIGRPGAESAAGAPSQASQPNLELKDRVEAYERGLIVEALEAHKQNRSHSARSLGINRATLHAKLRKYGLADANDADGSD